MVHFILEAYLFLPILVPFESFGKQSYLNPNAFLLKIKTVLRNVQVLIKLYNILSFIVSTIFTTIATTVCTKGCSLVLTKRHRFLHFYGTKRRSRTGCTTGTDQGWLLGLQRRVLVCAHRKRMQSIEKGQNEVARQAIEIDGEKNWEWEGPIPHSTWERVGGDEILRLNAGKGRWKREITRQAMNNHSSSFFFSKLAAWFKERICQRSAAFVNRGSVLLVSQFGRETSVYFLNTHDVQPALFLACVFLLPCSTPSFIINIPLFCKLVQMQ